MYRVVYSKNPFILYNKVENESSAFVKSVTRKQQKERKMKKSINAWAFPDTYTRQEVIKAAAAAGFDAVEFNLEPRARGRVASFDEYSTELDVIETAEAARAAGLTVPSISTSGYKFWTYGDEQSELLCIEMLKKQIRIAEIFGADTILLVMGGMDNGILLSEARKNALKAMRRALPIIENSSVCVGLENVGDFFFMSPYDMISFIKELGSDSVGVYLDLGNMLPFTRSEYWADVLAPYIKKIHIKDLKRYDYSKYGGVFCDLLKGDWNYAETMRVLKVHGFDGYLTAEVSKYESDMSCEDFLRSVCAAEDVIIDAYNEA